MIVTQIGPKDINDMFKRLRDTVILQMDYAALTHLICDPIKADDLTPAFWTLRGELIHKYSLDKATPYVDLRTAAMKLSQGSVKTPLDLANIN